MYIKFVALLRRSSLIAMVGSLSLLSSMPVKAQTVSTSGMAQLSGPSGVALFSRGGLAAVKKVRIVVEEFKNDEAKLGLKTSGIIEAVKKWLEDSGAGVKVTDDKSAPILYIRTLIMVNVAPNGSPLGPVGSMSLALEKGAFVASPHDEKQRVQAVVQYFHTETAFILSNQDAPQIGVLLYNMTQLFCEAAKSSSAPKKPK